MRITISGLPGSGTTTVAKILASKLKYKFISAGEIFRNLAEKNKLPLNEFSKLAAENPEYDLYVDEYQKKIGEREDNIIIEGRLSGWFVKDAFKVWIFASDETRYKRIAKREKKRFEEVKKETKEREKIEKNRYMRFYGINIDDLSIYHLVINSEYFNAESIANIIIKALEEKKWKL